jgi:hypothetical protein
VQYGASYVYHGINYECVAGVGLVAGFANGVPCSHHSDCVSTYCYPGPDQYYCVDAADNCAEPGADGVLYGQSYVYEGVTYDCVAGQGLVAQ